MTRKRRRLKRTAGFKNWLTGLNDSRAFIAISRRLLRIEKDGYLGDTHHVEGEVWELRLDVGAGYRIYYVTRGAYVLILLGGGDKRSQMRDIKAAVALAATLE